MHTKSGESPYSNGLLKRHNAVSGLTVLKTIEETKYDLETFKDFHQIYQFSENLNFTSACTDSLPALEYRTTVKLEWNLNALQSARNYFIKRDSFSKLKYALNN